MDPGCLSYSSPCSFCGTSGMLLGVCVISYWLMNSTRLNPTLSFHSQKKLAESPLPELPPEFDRPRTVIPWALARHTALVFLKGSEPEFHLYNQSDQESSVLSNSLGQ